MKTTLMLLLGMSSLFTLTAQHTNWGIKGGVNFATVNTESAAPDWGSRAGVHAGLLAHIHLNKTWAIQPELMYSLQGSKSTVSGGQTQTINLNYLNLPVLLQYMFNNGFRLQTGPQVGILLSSNSKLGDSHTTNTSLFNTSDFGWSFGGGFLAGNGLGIDARYNLGLTDIYKPGNMRETNSVFQVGLFYLLNYKK